LDTKGCLVFGLCQLITLPIEVLFGGQYFCVAYDHQILRLSGTRFWGISLIFSTIFGTEGLLPYISDNRIKNFQKKVKALIINTPFFASTHQAKQLQLIIN